MDNSRTSKKNSCKNSRFRESIKYYTYTLILLLLGCVEPPAVPTPKLSDQVAIEFHLDEFSIDRLEDRTAKDTSLQVEYLVIHCTATHPSVSWTRQDILEFFANERRWSRPGYRDFIDKEGILWNLRPYNSDSLVQYEEATWGARGYNWISWHIAYDGGVDKFLKAKDTRTKAQIATLHNYVTTIRTMFPNIKIVGHRDLPGVTKACPSFDVHAEYFDKDSLIDLNNLFDMALDSLD